MELLDRDKVLSLVKMRGPIIPNELRKALGLSETMMVGAVLSELSQKGLVKVSKTKIGGSPFYYDPAKPESLEKISEHLGEKDIRAFNILKEKLVLRDDKQDALVRVCLRNIKDFSRMLTINAPEGEVIYWKYYLVSDHDAEQMIKEDLGLTKAAPKVESAPVPETKPEESAAPAEPAVAPAAPAQPAQRPNPTPSAKVEEKDKEKPKDDSQEQLPNELEEINDPFYAKVKAYFDKQGITIKEQKLIRKKSELDFVISLPTPVGNVDYYCKAKSKKKSNDGDLASAKLQGNSKNLPVIYLTTGEITKKAKEKLQNDFKGLVVKEL